MQLAIFFFLSDSLISQTGSDSQAYYSGNFRRKQESTGFQSFCLKLSHQSREYILSSQHLESWGQDDQVVISATQQVQGQPGLYKSSSQKQDKQTKNKAKLGHQRNNRRHEFPSVSRRGDQLRVADGAVHTNPCSSPPHQHFVFSSLTAGGDP